jgi:hypothetical protein
MVIGYLQLQPTQGGTWGSGSGTCNSPTCRDASANLSANYGACGSVFGRLLQSYFERCDFHRPVINTADAGIHGGSGCIGYGALKIH